MMEYLVCMMLAVEQKNWKEVLMEHLEHYQLDLEVTMEEWKNRQYHLIIYHHPIQFQKNIAVVVSVCVAKIKEEENCSNHYYFPFAQEAAQCFPL